MPISVPISEFNVDINVATDLVYTQDDQRITTEATLNIPAASFKSMFSYSNGSLKFSGATGVYDGSNTLSDCSPSSILTYYLKRQAVSTLSSEDPNVVDSFKTTYSIVNNADMLTRNIMEHCVLEHSFERYSFIQAFVAIDQSSRNDFAKEIYIAGSTGASNINTLLTNSSNVAENLLFNISKLRTLDDDATLDDVIQNGDSYFFSVNIKSPDNDNFKEQYYKCIILLSDTDLGRCVQYGINGNKLMLIESDATIYQMTP